MKLVLGIGNDSKCILKPVEPKFAGINFSVLDSWCNVKDKTLWSDDMGSTFASYYSCFIDPPGVYIRDNADKYAAANFEEIIRYPPEQIKFYRDQLKSSFKVVVSHIDSYAEILLVCNLSNCLAVAWLMPLVTHLSAKAAVSIFSVFPVFGSRLSNRAKVLCESIIDTEAKHYVLFLHELAARRGKSPVSYFFGEVEDIRVQTLTELLLNANISSKMVRII